ncbi:MAG: hypothetical protein IKS85_03880 [Lachnospiraceae bacterium]|nr:hypothetical protein [Lachnospiraceae bacterium]
MKEHHDKWEITDRLRIPSEILQGEVRLTITGDHRVWAENFLAILEFRDTRLTLLGRSYKVTLEGKELTLAYYTREDLLLLGRVERIAYGSKEGTS